MQNKAIGARLQLLGPGVNNTEWSSRCEWCCAKLRVINHLIPLTVHLGVLRHSDSYRRP